MNTFPIYAADNRQLFSIVNQSYLVNRQIVNYLGSYLVNRQIVNLLA